MKTIQEIDSLKLKIEQKYIPALKNIFYHIAQDAKAFYLSTGKVPAAQLAKNYNPEFLKIIRDAQRESIKAFGFDIREDSELKNYPFKTAKYKALIDYHIETKDIEPLNQDGPIEKINRTFAFDAALFVANSSEEQVEYIDQTNEKDIDDAEKAAAILFFEEYSGVQKQISGIEEEIRRIEFEAMLGGSQSLAAAKKKKLLEKLQVQKRRLAELERDKNKIIADNIEKRLIEKGDVRSPLIASQNVGMAEAWSRNREATLLNDNIPELQIKKKWQAIIDGKTRPSHVVADNQVVAQNAKFTVGGYQAEFPRDPSLPIDETANCRCVAFHFFGEDFIAN